MTRYSLYPASSPDTPGSPKDFPFGQIAADGKLLKTQLALETAHILNTKLSDIRPGVLDSIGIARLHILVLGTTTIGAASTLLGLVWMGAATALDGGDPGQQWRNVINWGWAPVLVTICSAAIRTAMSLQAGVAMSMIASVLLEHHRVKLGDTAFFSIIRAVSVQPVGLLVAGGRGVVKSLGFFGLPLLLITSLIAIASTFTSSILLWDFGNIKILGDFNTSLVGFTHTSIATMTDVWRSPPAEFPRFAEYRNASDLITGHDHVDDTGLTFRVPLPMADKSQRESLREYSGPATVFDHRVVCTAPREFVIQSINETAQSDAVGSLSFGGYATFQTDLPLPLRGAEPNKQVPFNCMVPGIAPIPGVQSNITICLVSPPFGTDESPFSPLRLQPHLPFLDSPWYRPPIYFLLKVKGPGRPNRWIDFGNIHFDVGGASPNGFEIPLDALVTKREGPWAVTRLTGIELLEGLSVSTTACVMTSQGFPFNVTLRSETDGVEPALGWSGTVRPGVIFDSESDESLPESTYDTRAVLSQLNVMTPDENSPTLQQRGVMSLDYFQTDWSKPLRDPHESLFTLYPEKIFPAFRIIPRSIMSDPSAIMTLGMDSATGHPAHISLFHDALTATGGRPALALQSWMTTLTRQKYYDSLGRFTAGAEARYAHSIEVFVPREWNGFLGVMAMIGCHILVVVGVTAWFLAVNRHTMLGNSWQVVAQVVSDATTPLIERAGNLKDSEVRKITQQETVGGENGDLYGVVRNRSTGRMEVIGRRQLAEHGADEKDLG